MILRPSSLGLGVGEGVRGGGGIERLGVRSWYRYVRFDMHSTRA